MENKLISELEEQLNNIDINSIKLDAIIKLKIWQKNMFSLIDKIYFNRLNDIDIITLNIINDIKDKQNQLEQININDKNNLFKLQYDIDEFKSNIIINQIIPENFHYLIERTIHIKRDENQNNDDDDDIVIIDIDKNEEIPDEHVIITNSENCVSKIFHSEPVQQAVAVSLAKTLTHIGTMAATNTTTIAATTMAKTALLTTACGIGTMAYGMGRIAIGTTKKVWSFVISSDNQ